MPKYRVTINFETDRLLHADEQEQILWACHAQIEEPVDYDQNDIDVKVERLTESITLTQPAFHGHCEVRVSANDLAEHIKADIISDDELCEKFRACKLWGELDELCDTNVYTINACETYGVIPNVQLDLLNDARSIVAKWLPTRHEGVNYA